VIDVEVCKYMGVEGNLLRMCLFLLTLKGCVSLWCLSLTCDCVCVCVCAQTYVHIKQRVFVAT